MYIIQKRYQYYGPKGIQWTKWFTQHQCKTKEEANNLLKECKKQKEPNKLKNEFQIIEEE